MRASHTLLLVPALTLAMAGCGDDASDTGSSSSAAATPTPAAASGGQDLKVDAMESDSSLSFSMKTLSAKAGKVTLTMDNPKGNKQPHAISIEGNGVDADGNTVGPGGVSTVSATLKPGTYTYYCPIPGHESAGMKGTLKVS